MTRTTAICYQKTEALVKSGGGEVVCTGPHEQVYVAEADADKLRQGNEVGAGEVW